MRSKQALVALATGLLFGIGLVVSGMTQPAKVIGFLDFAGSWDPSLALVMAGAVGVFMPLYRWIARRAAPVCSTSFAVPTRRDIDAPLLLGAALFGIGWGLAGYCPGPALTSAGGLGSSALLFSASMLGGFALKRAYDQRRARREAAPARGAHDEEVAPS